MSRYIDADNYKKDLIQLGFLPALVVSVLDKQPTADVVEVVRCKDCKHGHRNGSGQLIGHYICEYDQNGCLKSSAHFCSYGESSENEHLLYG